MWPARRIDDEDGAVGHDPRQGAVDRVHDDDRPGQHPAIDQEARAVIGDDLGVAVPGEVPAPELVEGARQEPDPVRAVTQEVGGEELSA